MLGAHEAADPGERGASPRGQSCRCGGDAGQLHECTGQDFALSGYPHGIVRVHLHENLDVVPGGGKQSDRSAYGGERLGERDGQVMMRSQMTTLVAQHQLEFLVAQEV